MIAHLRGVVDAVSPNEAVVDIGGVGFSVQCGPATIAQLQPGTAVRLATSLVVREESLTLYGFGTDDERSLFELLQTASGVGPRVAQAILAVYAPDDVRRAIAGGNIAALTKVPGIGKKGAERLILELKDRIGPVVGQGSAASTPTVHHGQVVAGLVALGWSSSHAEQAAEQAAAQLRTDTADEPAVAAVLKQAIALLGRAR